MEGKRLVEGKGLLRMALGVQWHTEGKQEMERRQDTEKVKGTARGGSSQEMGTSSQREVQGGQTCRLV